MRRWNHTYEDLRLKSVSHLRLTPKMARTIYYRSHYGAVADCRAPRVGREACMCNDCFDKLCAIAEVMGTPMPKVGA